MSNNVDLCATHFTDEQVARMRCALRTFRTTLYDSVAVAVTSNSVPDSSRFMCPGGSTSGSSGARKYIVTVEFAAAGMQHDVAARELTLVPPLSSHFKFWPGTLGDSLVADSSATAANGYKTSFTVHHFGGCGADSMLVKLNGVLVGKAYFNVNSADFMPASPGIVDSGDLSALAEHLPPGPYAPCFDIDLNDGNVDSSDLSKFAAHLGHFRPGHPNKVFAVGDVVLRNDGEQDGVLSLGVLLENTGRFAASGIVLRVDESALQFVSWQPDESHVGVQSYAVPVRDEEGSRIVILAVSSSAQDWMSVRLGTLLWRSSRAIDLARDIQVTYADVARPDGTVLALQWSGKTSEPSYIEDVGDRLEPNEPNPFNPSTTLRYTIRVAGHVQLAILDVRGRIVRTLVNQHQRRDVHSVTWDGRTANGNSAPSGIYVARLITTSGRLTQKLTLLR